MYADNYILGISIDIQCFLFKNINFIRSFITQSIDYFPIFIHEYFNGNALHVVTDYF